MGISANSRVHFLHSIPRPGQILDSIPRPIQIAMVGYLIVGVFGVVLWLVRTRMQLNSKEDLLVAALAAGPLLVACIWRRLTGFKLGGLEVTLESAKVGFEALPNLPDAESGRIKKDSRSSIRRGIKSLREKRLEIATVALSSDWLLTRLYLFAAMAEDFTTVRRIAFVEDENSQRYLGMASPRAVRIAIERINGECEARYRKVVGPEWFAQVPGDPELDSIPARWAKDFGGSKKENDGDRLTRLSSLNLEGLFGVPSEHDQIEWDEKPTEFLFTKILSSKAKYVALTKNGGLAQIVKRSDLASQIALELLR